MRRHGFTLIELLVVIAIIAILAAILFPVFAKAREKARQSSCLSNMKQMVIAVSQYAQDYDECLPSEDHRLPGGDGNTVGVDGSWRGAIFPYCKNAQMFFCPSHSVTGTKFDGRINDCGLEASYCINDCHQDSPEPTPPTGFISIGRCEDASSVIFIMESAGGDDDQTPADNNRGWVPTAANFLRHNGGANYGFVDGHAKWLKPSAIDSATTDSFCSIEKE